MMNIWEVRSVSEFKFILEQCSTNNKQKEALVRIREAILKYENVNEFPNTRHIKYGQIESNPFAEIVWKKGWKNPKLILKLPRLTKYKRELVENHKKRYGLEISPDGIPNTRVQIYELKELNEVFDVDHIELCGSSGLLQKLVGNELSEPDEIYQELIDLALKVNFG